MKKLAVILLLVSVSVQSYASNGTSSPDNKICGMKVGELNKIVNSKLDKKRWVLVFVEDCKDTQDEILQNLPELIGSDDFYSYLPFISKSSMRLVRNAFFAVKGYRFKSKELQNFYKRYDWYKPTNNNSVVLTKEEKDIVNTLKKIEDIWAPSDHSFSYKPSSKLVVFKILCHFLTMAKSKGMTHDPIQSSLRHGRRPQGIA